MKPQAKILKSTRADLQSRIDSSQAGLPVTNEIGHGPRHIAKGTWTGYHLHTSFTLRYFGYQISTSTPCDITICLIVWYKVYKHKSPLVHWLIHWFTSLRCSGRCSWWSDWWHCHGSASLEGLWKFLEILQFEMIVFGFGEWQACLRLPIWAIDELLSALLCSPFHGERHVTSCLN